MMPSAYSLSARLWPSCPGLAPPGLACSRLAFGSLVGGLDEGREFFWGRCSRSTSSISSALLSRSSSSRCVPGLNQRCHPAARGVSNYEFAQRDLTGIDWRAKSGIDWRAKYSPACLRFLLPRDGLENKAIPGCLGVMESRQDSPDL